MNEAFEHQLSIPFDQYQRYKIVSDIVNKYRRGDGKFRILEIGASYEENLKKFLPDDNIYFLDIDYQEEYRQIKNYIIGDITKIELKDEYDFIVSIDCYEHILPNLRSTYVEKLLGQSRKGTIIAAPFDTTGVKETEILLNNLYRLQHGEDHRWLKEHIENGLPSLSQTIRIIEDLGFNNYTILPNGYLPRWFKVMSVILMAGGGTEYSQILQSLSEFYNSNFYKYDNANPAYRQVIVISKISDAPDFKDLLSKDAEADPDFKSRSDILQTFLERFETVFKNNSAYVKDLDTAIKEKDTRIGSLEEAVNEKDGQIATLDAAIKEKEARIGNLEDAIQERNTQIGSLEEAVNEKDRQITIFHAAIREKEATLTHIYNSHGWKALLRYYKFRDTLLPMGSKRRKVAKYIWNFFREGNRQNIRKSIFYIRKYGFAAYLQKAREKLKSAEQVIVAGVEYENSYQAWIKKNEPEKAELQVQQKSRFPYEPKISIIVPAFNTPEQFLRDTIESLLNQTYPNWELCIADGVSTQSHVRETLEAYAEKDSRIRIRLLDGNRDIAEISNEALSLASGDYICPLLPVIELAPFAFYEIAKLLNEHPGTDFIYSDHDSISLDGKQRFAPQFKPNWSPDTLRSCNYIGSFFAFKKNLIQETQYRHNVADFDQSDIYDLILNVTEKAKAINHIPKILYHTRQSICNGPVTEPVEKYSDAGEYKNSFLKIQDKNLTTNASRFEFSLVILSKDKPEFIIPLLDTLLKGDINSKYEVIVGDTGTTDRKVLTYYHQVESKIKIIKDIKYHFAKNYNFIIRQYTAGEIVGIMNNDIILRNMSFLDQMKHVFSENVGSVGAAGIKLLYPDGRLQHGGVFFMEGRDINRGMPYHRLHGSSPDVLRAMKVENVPAVTGAFMFVNKKDFIALNGFDEQYKVEAQDIDFCLKCVRMGKKILFVNIDGITHVENGTRPKGSENTDDREYFLWKWRGFLNAAVLGTELNKEFKS